MRKKVDVALADDTRLSGFASLWIPTDPAVYFVRRCIGYKMG
jgi:hypothetical protein